MSFGGKAHSGMFGVFLHVNHLLCMSCKGIVVILMSTGRSMAAQTDRQTAGAGQTVGSTETWLYSRLTMPHKCWRVIAEQQKKPN